MKEKSSTGINILISLLVELYPTYKKNRFRNRFLKVEKKRDLKCLHGDHFTFPSSSSSTNDKRALFSPGFGLGPTASRTDELRRPSFLQ